MDNDHHKMPKYFAVFMECLVCDVAHMLAAAPERALHDLEESIKLRKILHPNSPNKLWISEVEIKPIINS